MDKFIENLFKEKLPVNKNKNNNTKVQKKNTKEQKGGNYKNKLNSRKYKSYITKYTNELNKIADKRNGKVITIHDLRKMMNGGTYDGFCDNHPTQCGVVNSAGSPLSGGGSACHSGHESQCGIESQSGAGMSSTEFRKHFNEAQTKCRYNIFDLSEI